MNLLNLLVVFLVPIAFDPIDRRVEGFAPFLHQSCDRVRQNQAEKFRDTSGRIGNSVVVVVEEEQQRHHRWGSPALSSFARILVAMEATPTKTPSESLDHDRSENQTTTFNTTATIITNNGTKTETDTANTTVTTTTTTHTNATTKIKPKTGWNNSFNFGSRSNTIRGSGLGSYFSFRPQSQPTAAPKDSPVGASSKTGNDNNAENKSRDNAKLISNNKSASGNQSATALLNKKGNETITVADLEVFLAKIQSPNDPNPRNAIVSSTKNGVSNNKAGQTTITNQKPISASSSSSSSSQVAFPQPSTASRTAIRRSTGFTGGIFGMFLGITILPNLWLVGMVLGAFYGYDITKELPEHITDQPWTLVDKNVVANFLIVCGAQLANVSTKVSDGGKALWFLYKTGQLSYEYYKTYETLDSKFAIQNKVDAWNRMFVTGKQKFDAWEQQNEVGRKVLAGLRTAWLVDEQSKLKAEAAGVRRSKYRLVQSLYDLRRSLGTVVSKIRTTWTPSLVSGELRTFLRGLKTDLQSTSNSNRLVLSSDRLRAMGAALVAVNVFGALFSLSAVFSSFLALLVALVWPSWATDIGALLGAIWSDTVATGEWSAELTNKAAAAAANQQTNRGLFPPLEFLREKYEEYSSNRVQESNRNRRKQNQYNRNRNRNRNYSYNRGYSNNINNNRLKRNRRRKSATIQHRNNFRQTKKPSSFSWFGVGTDTKSKRRKGRRNRRLPPETGTWPYFRRTRW